ncbi:MAG: hypothetical protein M1821_008661 [Bathelium mastoideum]|nr:MAG: hypothetical protein M1821_008661 [Bathelium mastoideum]
MFRSRVVQSRILYRTLLSRGRIPTRRNFQVFRPPADVSAREVRIKRPSIFNWKRLASFGIYSGCTLACYFYFFPEIEIEEASEGEGQEGDEVDSVQEGDIDYMEPDDDSLFIPLSFAKRKERSYYRGSDPEWQEFIRLANDKPRHQKVHQDLVKLIMMHVNAHAPFAHSLGGTIKASKVWLDIQFPNGPPPEFERTGIIITDDYIALATKTSTEMEEQRISRTLWPSAAFAGVYASMRVLFRIQWQRAKETLGIQTKPSKEDEMIRQSLRVMRQIQEGQIGRPSANVPEANPGVPKPPPTDQERVQPQSSSTAKGEISPRHSADPRPAIPGIPVLPSSSLPSGSEIPLALHVFHHTMSQNLAPKKLEAPRGTCVLSGLVEVSGSKARATLDVKAAYHPQQATFVAISVGVRSFKLYRQPPMGGP